MPLAHVLDEHLRGPLWSAIERHNSASEFRLDAVRVGDLDELPLRTRDRELLIWAEHAGRILVTRDHSTMPGHLEVHLRAGHHCPGVMAVRRRARIQAVLAFLLCAAYASEPSDWNGQIVFIP
jgi:hypothetical protein